MMDAKSLSTLVVDLIKYREDLLSLSGMLKIVDEAVKSCQTVLLQCQPPSNNDLAPAYVDLKERKTTKSN